MSKYISWREMHSLSLVRARELAKAGQIWVTADGDTVFRLVPVGPQNDNQSALASVEKQRVNTVASAPNDNQATMLHPTPKFHEEVDIHCNIVMARGKPRQNMQEAR